VESFINETEKLNPDIIFWLGDNPPHNTYEQKKNTQLEYFRYVARLLKKSSFKGKVYTIMGNHESFPAGQFDIYHGTTRWLTKGYADELKEWYPPDAVQMMEDYGYFSILHPGTKLRVIGLNTYSCDFPNLYLLGNSTDPLGMLAWLEKELHKSELNGESVMIIGHVAAQSKSGTNCIFIKLSNNQKSMELQIFSYH